MEMVPSHNPLQVISVWVSVMRMALGTVIVAGFGYLLLYAMAATSNRAAMQALGRRISGPLVATAIFVAALYVWEIPALHDAAERLGGVHMAAGEHLPAAAVEEPQRQAVGQHAARQTQLEGVSGPVALPFAADR